MFAFTFKTNDKFLRIGRIQDAVRQTYGVVSISASAAKYGGVVSGAEMAEYLASDTFFFHEFRK